MSRPAGSVPRMKCAWLVQAAKSAGSRSCQIGGISWQSGYWSMGLNGAMTPASSAIRHKVTMTMRPASAPLFSQK